MSSALPRVTIALCTYNGAPHLPEQLASYLAQDHTAWDLWVRDDGSTDDTWAILEAFRDEQAPHRTVRLLRGTRYGPALNYARLLCDPDFPEGPVAMSDQDDVWYPDKLGKALRALEGAGEVALYGAQSRHTDDTLTPIGRSNAYLGRPSFANALTQNIVSGHSATLSAGALAVVRAAGHPQADIPYFDWWLYQIVSGAGGTIVVRPDTVLDYRQHADNAMGAHDGPKARLDRIRKVLGKAYGAWLTQNLTALSKATAVLDDDSRRVLGQVQRARRWRGPLRAVGYARAGLHRQTALTTAAFYLAALAGRI
jgi:glycosyltransferase involved in cell wall biosynthesis